jgi:hypothetical protein
MFERTAQECGTCPGGGHDGGCAVPTGGTIG